MNDPFALDLTIRLLMLGIGSAMFAGSFFAYVNKNKNENEFYKPRTIFLGVAGFIITVWTIASLLNN
tara:strand:+ start:1804 stop:2004 length:201 start_codon:yes stop_codon:yes gene_type:complete